jgi:hypothetical protein
VTVRFVRVTLPPLLLMVKGVMPDKWISAVLKEIGRLLEVMVVGEPALNKN